MLHRTMSTSLAPGASTLRISERCLDSNCFEVRPIHEIYSCVGVAVSAADVAEDKTLENTKLEKHACKHELVVCNATRTTETNTVSNATRTTHVVVLLHGWVGSLITCPGVASLEKQAKGTSG
jgi:hypothetical protein